jgi:hypothetical protein
MYTREWLAGLFGDWQVLELKVYDAVIHEGQGHSGISALIDLVARKRTSGSDSKYVRKHPQSYRPC